MGLGLCDSSTTADFEFNSSVLVTSPLIHEIIQQCTHFSATVLSDQCQAKADINVVSSRHQKQASRVSELTPLLPDNLCHVKLFNFLVRRVPHLDYQCFPLRNMALHSIRMLLGMHCICDMVGCSLPAKCVHAHGFTVDHAMSFSSGGFPTLHHNELRDFTATALSEVCHDVAIEPVLQPPSGESFHYATANVEDEARLDVCVRGF